LLINATADDIQVVIHPQSVIHSMVSYNDGSVLAQLGNPDMRTPIAHAMAWPERMNSGVAQLDIFKVAQLNFQQPDLNVLSACAWPMMPYVLAVQLRLF